MRFLFLILAAGLLVQCANGRGNQASGAGSGDALVIVGIAETSDNRDPSYSLLWRKLTPDGAFADYDDARSIDVRTNSDSSIRVDGIPGEFDSFRVSPGVYALDSAFATLREGGANYIAQGVIERPQRPSFEVRAGEAVYLGIWEMDVDGANAVTRLWRLDQSDLDAVLRASRGVAGSVRLLQTESRSVPCAPRRMGPMSQRQVC